MHHAHQYKLNPLGPGVGIGQLGRGRLAIEH